MLIEAATALALVAFSLANVLVLWILFRVVS